MNKFDGLRTDCRKLWSCGLLGHKGEGGGFDLEFCVFLSVEMVHWKAQIGCHKQSFWAQNFIFLVLDS